MTAFTLSNVGPVGPAGSSSILEWKTLDVGNTTSPQFLAAWSSSGAPVVEALSTHLISAATLSALRASLDTSVAYNITFTVHINGIATAMTCTITAGNTSASDLVHTAAANDNDLVSLEMVTASAGGSANKAPTVSVAVGT